MRKNNEGYVLPFVLVVMIVLTIIATSLMTAALRNLQSQQKFTERMVDKYQAEGEIEKIVAMLSEKNHFAELTVEKDNADPDLTPDPTEKSKLQLAVEAKLKDVMKVETVSCKEWVNSSGNVEFTVELKGSGEVTEIVTTIQFSGELKEKETETPNASNGGTATTVTYAIDNLKLSYNSYEISTGGGT